ncbi:MAG: tRNA (adenosine(37)-N6)-threonylcarbamoyltransferase complex ATPase subunit type 1 TsaE [Oligoflexia bacterium]|nr:tRNA (adenosine(37)-N6)-threonylcarbamoyltransferase complex ATPase subunit type 1 TsaE [Oligoflexia bacterium]
MKLVNAKETENFGQEFAQNLKPGDIVKITGILGAGKTTFVRGVVEALGGQADEVHSPTFSIVHEYGIEGGAIIHCDFYRLPDNSDLEEFGGLEFFEEEKIYLIEWPEKIRLFKSVFQRRLIDVHFEIVEDFRMVKITWP